MCICQQCDEQDWKRPLHPKVLSVGQTSMESALTSEESIYAQATYPFCLQLTEAVRIPVSAYQCVKEGFLVRFSPLYGALQKGVPNMLQVTMLYLSQYPVIEGQHGCKCICGTMRKQIHWSQNAHDTYGTLKDCLSCTSTRWTQYNHQNIYGCVLLVRLSKFSHWMALDHFGRRTGGTNSQS